MRVQRAQYHLAPVEERDELTARERIEVGNRFEVGVDPVEQPLGQPREGTA